MYLNSESCQIYLRLSYNAFIGTAPAELSNPTNLELVHLHSNRITGEIRTSISFRLVHLDAISHKEIEQ
jgi:hypothetical protein